MCGSERLGPRGRLLFSEGDLWLRFSLRSGRRNRSDFKVEFGRACRDCGALTMVLDDDVRARFDQLADELPAESGPGPVFVRSPSGRMPDS